MQVIQIRCFDRCVYNLEFPKFFEEYTLAKCKKLFQFLFQFDYKPGNDETIAFLDVALPALIEEKKQEWADRSRDFQNGYRLTSAKSKYDHAQKVWESYTGAKAKFS